MGSCYKILKYATTFFNSILCMFASGSIIFLVLILAAPNLANDMQKLLDGKSISGVKIVKIFFIFHACVVMATLSFCSNTVGIVGSIVEKAILIRISMAFTTFVAVAKVIGVIIFFAMQKTAKNWLISHTTAEMQAYSSLTKEKQQYIDNYQNQLKCCGCKTAEDFMPNSTTPTVSPSGVCNVSFKEPCCDKLWSNLYGKAMVACAFAGAILLIEIIAIMLSFRLQRMVSRPGVRRGNITFVVEKGKDNVLKREPGKKLIRGETFDKYGKIVKDKRDYSGRRS